MEIRLEDYQYYIRPGYTGKGAQSLALAISPENPFKPCRLILQSGLWRDLSCPSLESYEERCERYLESAGLDGLSLEELRKVSQPPAASRQPVLPRTDDGKYITVSSLKEAVLSGALDEVSGLGEFSIHEACTAESFHSAFLRLLGEELYTSLPFPRLCQRRHCSGTQAGPPRLDRLTLMANRLCGELMGKRTGGKTRNYCYLW